MVFNKDCEGGAMAWGGLFCGILSNAIEKGFSCGATLHSRERIALQAEGIL